MSLQEKYGVTRDVATLSNGIRVQLFSKPNSPISLRANFIAGARFDPEDKVGLAHFAEHIIAAGTPSYPTRESIAEFIANTGGYMNASTGKELMGIILELSDKNDFASYIKLLSEFICEPILDEKTIEKERGAIQSELARAKSNPSKMLSENSNKLLFQNTEVGKMTLGTAESINYITKQDIVDYYAKFITCSNLSITVAGDISINELTDVLERYFINLKKGTAVEIKGNLPVNRENFISTEYFKGDNVNLDLDFRSVPRWAPDASAVQMLGNIFNGPSGLMMKKLRFDKALVYHAGAGSTAAIDRGVIGFSAGFSKNNLGEVPKTICDEIRRIKESGVTSEELSLVKNRIIKSKKRTMQTADSWVDYHAGSFALYPDKNWTIEDSIGDLLLVTQDDLQRVAQKYLTKDNYYLTATGNIEDADLTAIEIRL